MGDTGVDKLYEIFSKMIELQQQLKSLEKQFTRESNKIHAVLSMQACHISNSQRERDKGTLFCDHCKNRGHTKEKCFKLHGYPPGWQKRRSRSGGVERSNWDQASHTALTGEIPMVDVQTLEKFKSRLRLSESSSSFPGARDRKTSWDWHHA